MPREVHFYECAVCEEQYEHYSDAEKCEWEHDYWTERVKEQTS